jgi:hypothetical protein
MTTYDFPAVRDAMDARAGACIAARGLGWKPGFDHPLEERREWQRKHDTAEASYDGVVAAYASELLPAILGGGWVKSGSALSVSAPRLRFFASQTIVAGDWCRTLFDHPLHFRRQGSKGKLTWRTCALIGQPYNHVLRPDGGADPEAQADAASLAEHGIGSWMRRDLSAWYPGWTTLVLAATGLHPEDAPRFGFVALGAAAAR